MVNMFRFFQLNIKVLFNKHYKNLRNLKILYFAQKLIKIKKIYMNNKSILIKIKHIPY